MRFQIQPLREFLVRPAIPPALSRLPGLAYNVLWSWDRSVRALFRRLDPQMWNDSGHNPVLMLSALPQATLEKAAADSRYLALYRRACERFDAYVHKSESPSSMLVAYFCMEFGLVECMPTYSGGLGILAGDHLKAASDSSLPLVAVGLLYQKGYLRQSLNPDGWQIERFPENDFYTLPLAPVYDASGAELRVRVNLPAGEAAIKVWQIEVGRVRLLLLDTNIAENEKQENRDITDQLYSGDMHTRIRQEIVLGIGGPRALREVGLEPTVYHMNEGHSAFLAVERIRLLMRDQNLNFAEALEASRTNNVFTTHTSVPAGIDLFDPGLVFEYFHDYCQEAGIPFEQFLALGRQNPHDPHERFSMAVCAIKSGSYRNAVSRLHREISQEMWQNLWPQLPTWEVPITSITNGVHMPTWLHSDLAALYDQNLQPDWMDRYEDHKTWDLVLEIPDAELWEAHKRRKRRLINFARERVMAAAVARKASAVELRRLEDVLDPDTLTIGFARRFATYKRATLLFRDVARLKRILTNPEMPVQIVVAGKAHPKDHPGKVFIREIWQLSRDPEISKHLVFVEDYGIEVSRELVRGVDLWLNNPRRGEEACGTSGMKAGLNGVLSLSILDGWFDEAYEISGGWAVGDREPYSEDQDEIHASAIYSLLENEIVPLFYQDREEDVPVEWLHRVKQCLRNLSPLFNSQRMLGQYRSELYEPAHRAFADISRENFQPVRERARWLDQVRRVWDSVTVIDAGPPLNNSIVSGLPIPLRAVVDLAGLTPDDVRVEAVIGRLSVDGHLKDTTVVTLSPVGQQGSACVFGREFLPHHTGRLGYSLRVSPNHSDDPLTRPCNAFLKWA